jgi:hypothetical protein
MRRGGGRLGSYYLSTAKAFKETLIGNFMRFISLYSIESFQSTKIKSSGSSTLRYAHLSERAFDNFEFCYKSPSCYSIKCCISYELNITYI